MKLFDFQYQTLKKQFQYYYQVFYSSQQVEIHTQNLKQLSGPSILYLIDRNQKLAIKKIEDVLKFFEKKYHELCTICKCLIEIIY